jgi:tetratricopeptide (TPR) repeat protein
LLKYFDELFLVTTPDRIALSQAKRVADYLRHGCGFRAMHLVVNRDPGLGAAEVGEIEALTGLDVYSTLKDSEEEVHEALLAGRLITDNTRLGGQMRALTRRLAGLPSSGSESVSGLVNEGRKLWTRIFQRAAGSIGIEPALETMPETAWESLWRAGEEAFKSEQFLVAAKHFAQAAEKAEQFGVGDARLGKTLSRLGAVQCQLGRYPESERLLKRAARILEGALGESDPSLLDALSNLARAYKATGEYLTAKQLYDRVLKAAEGLGGPSHSMVARTFDELGDLHLAQGEPAAALYAYRRALAMKERTAGPGDWDVGLTLDKLSQFYCDQGRYNEAEPLLWRSLEIRKTVLGNGAPSLAKLYLRLGSLYAAQRKFSHAQRLLRYGISMLSAQEHSDEAVPYLRKLGEVYEGLARFGDAEAVRTLLQSMLSSAPGTEVALAREFDIARLVIPQSSDDLGLGWAATR